MSRLIRQTLELRSAARRQQVLTDREFVAERLGADGPERKIPYEDPDLGLASWPMSTYGAGESKKPHDHGPTWAISLTPGKAYVDNEGDLHSPRRHGATKLIRVESGNVQKIRRLAYEAI